MRATPLSLCGQMGSRTGIPVFYVAFVVAPLASNTNKLVSILSAILHRVAFARQFSSFSHWDKWNTEMLGQDGSLDETSGLKTYDHGEPWCLLREELGRLIINLLEEGGITGQRE